MTSAHRLLTRSRQQHRRKHIRSSDIHLPRSQLSKRACQAVIEGFRPDSRFQQKEVQKSKDECNIMCLAFQLARSSSKQLASMFCASAVRNWGPLVPLRNFLTLDCFFINSFHWVGLDFFPSILAKTATQVRSTTAKVVPSSSYQSFLLSWFINPFQSILIMRASLIITASNSSPSQTS